MSVEKKIKELTARGYGAEAIAKLTDAPLDTIMPLMPQDPPQQLACDFDLLPYDQALEAATPEAIAALRRIMKDGKSDSAIVSAANAVLDRAKGRPVQTTHIDQRVSYTIVSAIPAPPNSGALADQSEDVIDNESN